MAVKVELEIDEETYKEVQGRLLALRDLSEATNNYVQRTRKLLALNGAIMALTWFVLGASFGILVFAVLTR
jgi:uncharacterized membrane protein